MQIGLARGLFETTAGAGLTVKFIEGVAHDRAISADEVESEFFGTIRPLVIAAALRNDGRGGPLSSATNGAALRVEGGVVRSIL